ncbi:heterokaryon incompatibility protein-domain-containing protein [Cercophora newfieldiana]|uniref:Heterokaryon incompatibility protein-domain-containing protein n=1 Tax=Cercophora newfieldiana TaxID=92897 RepID=A0AA40CRZ4_9PEZI|nr:heterokaryon incompatibility protein-domain-containing protein [Cercophora newfieldiana]
MSSANVSSPLASDPDCVICKTAAALVRTGTNPWPSQITESMFQPAARLGTVKDYIESAAKCSDCQVLFAKLAAPSNDGQIRPLADDDVVEMAYLRFAGVWEINITQPTSPFKSKSQLTCLRVIRHVDPQDPNLTSALQKGEMTAFAMNRCTADFSRVQGWMSYCDTHHQGSCFQIEDPWKRMESPPSLYFVDTEDECVSLQSEPGVYLTLSYVWGTNPSPLTSIRANIDALGTPHSLAESSPLGMRLPRTIRDAMAVTRTLGYRYLWVDRLCIVQDDEVHKSAQLAGMAAIYSNSSLTIIADSGGDEAGLPGVTSDSIGRHPFTVLCLPGDTSLVIDESPDLSGQSEASLQRAYRYRGWTLQEELLSNRTLKFNRQEVRWMCRKSRFREVHNDEPQICDNRKSSLEIQLFKPSPDMQTYGHLATDYTGRFLSFDSDAVYAFSAIIAAFSKSMSGGMLYGLPEFLFEGVMLWQSLQPLRRRSAPTAAPSWSFLGWQGPGLDLKSWSALYLNTGRDKYRRDVYFNSAFKILPCVDYYKIDARSGNRVLIESSYQPRVTDNDVDFSDSSYPHKVPIPPEPFSLPQISSWSPILAIRTQKCNIRAGDILPSDGDDPREGQCKDVSLLDDNGAVVGVVRLNSTINTISGTVVSLVVISRGGTSQRSRAWGLPELNVFHAQCGPFCFPGSDSCRAEKRFVPYDFYNVLWVTWVDGIAYREGIGRVLRSAWEALGSEEAEIKLG